MDRILELSNKELVISKTACKAIGVIGFIALTALGAFIRIPLLFSPVPVTLQTFFVLLSGAILGKKMGLLSQSGYIALGGIGLPVFSAGAFGFVYLLGPTGGYILGFLISAWLVGCMIQRLNKTFINAVLIMATGSIIILCLGTIWLSAISGYSVKKALLIGMLPFIPGDAVKVIVAAFIYNRGMKRFDKIFN